MTVAGLIEALQKMDPEAFVVVNAYDDSQNLWPVAFVKMIKAVNWSEGGNDPGMYTEGDAAGAYDVVYIGAQPT